MKKKLVEHRILIEPEAKDVAKTISKMFSGNKRPNRGSVSYGVRIALKHMADWFGIDNNLDEHERMQ